MIDAELLADLRRLVNALRLPEYIRDLTGAVPDKLVKQIAEDFRSYNPHPTQAPSAKVTVQGAGKVVTAGESEVPQSRSGWRDSAPLKQPEGLQYVDAMLDEEDRIWRGQRIKELAGASRAQRALAEAAAEAEQKAAQAEQPKPKGERK
jgi:hypothetical protein